MKRPFPLYLLSFLHFALGISASIGGAMLVVQPDGSLLGMQAGWLQGSSFDTYFIPGALLFSLIGCGPLFISGGLIWKPQWPWANILNMYPDRYWAWTYSLYEGIIVIAWIAFQILMTSSFWLQPIVIIIGLLIIIGTMVPSVQKYFEAETMVNKKSQTPEKLAAGDKNQVLY